MPKGPVSRVLLIGWDAADWQMINPLMESGRMPHLERLIENGVMGNISTLSPILSPILWNSIATGKHGDKHGILGFIEPDGKGNVRPVASTSRKAKAIWNIASQKGLASNIVNWYASHPSEPIKGCIMSDRYCRIGTLQAEHPPCDEFAIHPPRLREEMLALRVSANDITAEQILPFIPHAARIDQQRDNRLAEFCIVLAECATVHNAATYLMEHEPWDFMAVYYDMIDHMGHGFMEFHPPRMEHVREDEFELFKDVMNGCYMWHDMMLGRLMELAGPDTTIILISDHGFYNDAMRPKFVVDEMQPGVRFGPGVNPIAWHRPFGIFCAGGPRIKRDELVFGASLLDIAPTVLACLGLSIPRDMDGKPLTQMFSKPVPLEYTDSYEAPHPDDGVHRGAMADDPYSAQVVFERLIELGYIDAPGDDQARAVQRTILDHKHNLAQIYFGTNRVEQALGIYESLLSEDDSPHLRSRMAMCLTALGRLAEAEVLLAEPAREPENHPIASILYAQVLTAKRRYAEALAILQKVQTLNVRLPRVFVHMGRIYNQQQRFDLAESAFRQALASDPDEPEAHDGLGVALRHLGRHEDAVYEHMRSASLFHARAETHMNLGVALADLKQIDWAIQAFKVAAELAPRHPFPHRCLARLYHRAKHDPDTARYHAGLAMKLRKQLHDAGITTRDDARSIPVRIS